MKRKLFLILLSAIFTVGFTSVKALKPVVTGVEMQYSSNVLGPWESVDGNLTNGYKLCIDPVVSFYYFNIDTLINTGQPLKTSSFNQNAFKIDQTSLPSNWLTYWDAKGVNAGAATGTWQAYMYQIVIGAQPVFYIKYNGTSYTLIDGMTYQMSSTEALLRISGDYPLWNYLFTGTVTGNNDEISDIINIHMTINTVPYLTSLTLQSSTIETGPFTDIKGNITDGYKMCIDDASDYYYYNISNLVTNVPISQDTNAFYLSGTQSPAFFAYWNTKGVNASAAAGTWEAVMWKIINGQKPMFYVKFDGTDYKIIDGLQYIFAGVVKPLRVAGDYPKNTYKFDGKLKSSNGCYSDNIEVKLTFNTTLEDVTIKSATVETGPWTSIPGSLINGFTIALDTVVEYYYIDINTITTTDSMAVDTNAFYLSGTQSAAFFSYWDAKGVNASSAAGTWEAVMWKIINGQKPMFYLKYDGTNYKLIDGLQYIVSNYTLEKPLRITGNYPKANYTFKGLLKSKAGCYSDTTSIGMTVIYSPELLVSTDVATTITTTGAKTGGTINATGVTVTQKGVCYSDSPNPTLANSSTTEGPGSGHFVSNLTGLAPHKTYYIRAYAITSSQTVYGDEKSFTTANVGITEVETTNFNVYPNPTIGDITIEGAGVKKIEVINASGKLIMTKEVKGGEKNQINIENQARGIYFIKIISTEGTSVKKIIKK